jgi:methyl-accepting chemotaxis protein
MMQVLRIGSRLLERTSPLGLLAAGAVLAVSLPPVRKGLRCAAVVTTRGVLGALDYAQELAANVREQAEDLVAEARSGESCDVTEGWEEAFETAKNYPRDLVVSAASAGLAVSERVNEHAKAVKEHVSGVVEEAKSRRSRITSPVNNIESTNESTNEDSSFIK